MKYHSDRKLLPCYFCLKLCMHVTSFCPTIFFNGKHVLFLKKNIPDKKTIIKLINNLLLSQGASDKWTILISCIKLSSRFGIDWNSSVNKWTKLEEIHNELAAFLRSGEDDGYRSNDFQFGFYNFDEIFCRAQRTSFSVHASLKFQQNYYIHPRMIMKMMTILHLLDDTIVSHNSDRRKRVFENHTIFCGSDRKKTAPQGRKD